MRVRTILTTCTTALLLAGLSPASAAAAGTGSSMSCSDGSGNEVVVDDTALVTLAVQNDPNFLMVCYSTAPETIPGQVTGGHVDVFYTATLFSPNAAVIMRCTTDYQFGIAPECLNYVFVTTDTTNITLTTYPNHVCVVDLAGCQLWADGYTLETNTSTAPLASVDTFGTYVPVDIPGGCIGILVTPCP